jgi:hypothetical protein
LREILGEEEYYKLHGRHSTVYPVQLPIWTDPNIVQALNKRFSMHLRLRHQLETVDYYPDDDRRG